MQHTRLPLANRNRLLVLSMLPFPLAILATFAMVLLVGERFPRQIAPGSSLVWHGLALSGLVFLAVIHHVWRQWTDLAPRRFALTLASVTSLMAWPVWTTAILPSVNGVKFGPKAASAMHVVKLMTSRPKKSNRLYYWATLRPIDPRAPIGAGRYVVDKAAYERWQLAPTRPAQVVHVEGLLGARIALAFR